MVNFVKLVTFLRHFQHILRHLNGCHVILMKCGAIFDIFYAILMKCGTITMECHALLMECCTIL